MVDYTPILTIIISLSALGVSAYAAITTHIRGKRTEKITSKWEQIRIAREIFTAIFSLENRLIDLGADQRATEDPTEKKRLQARAEAIGLTSTQHLDYFADLILSGRIEGDVLVYYITHMLRVASVNSLYVSLKVFGPNLLKLLSVIAGLTGQSVDELLGTKKKD